MVFESFPYIERMLQFCNSPVRDLDDESGNMLPILISVL